MSALPPRPPRASGYLSAVVAFPEQELILDDALLPWGAPREADARLRLGLGPEVHGLARHWGRQRNRDGGGRGGVHPGDLTCRAPAFPSESRGAQAACLRTLPECSPTVLTTPMFPEAPTALLLSAVHLNSPTLAASNGKNIYKPPFQTFPAPHIK